MNREQRRRGKEPKNQDKEGRLKYSSPGIKPASRKHPDTKAPSIIGRKIGPFGAGELLLLLPSSVLVLGMGIYNIVAKKAGPGFFGIMIGLTGFLALVLKLVPRKKQWLLLAGWVALAVLLLVLFQKV